MVLFSSSPDLAIPQQDFFSYNVDQLKKHGDKVAIVSLHFLASFDVLCCTVIKCILLQALAPSWSCLI